MKQIRCPKCEGLIPFDISAYEPGQALVFECPHCHKQFRIRIPQPQKEEDKEEVFVPALLVVIENMFHFKQEIPLQPGRNIVGRYVKGTKANAAIRTNDPSIDTTHCIITISERKGRGYDYVLQDAPSNTGTSVMDHFLGNKERVALHDGDIITIGATTMIFRTHEGTRNEDNE